jgi:APA family basic amino acid/polyamine antiporter
MSEEAATPSKTVPRAYAILIFAVLVLFAGISIVALSAMPVHPCTPADHCPAGTHYTTALATTYKNDPVAGIVKALPSPYKEIMLPLVAILASSILLIAANAGVLGASRLSFSMGTYRQVPKILNQVQKRFKTPVVAIAFFGLTAILIVLPGDITQLTALYIFGSTLGFTMAHASLIAMRLKETPERRSGFRLGLNVPFKGKQIPITAVLGGIGTLTVFVLIALSDTFGRDVGFSWMIVGVVVYVVYRKRNNLSLTESAERRFEMR